MSYVKEIEDYLNLRYAKLEMLNNKYVVLLNNTEYKKIADKFVELQAQYNDCEHNLILCEKNLPVINKIMLSNKEFIDAYSKNSNLLKQCEKYFPKEISSLNEEFKKINKGFASENNVFERIIRNVPKEWKILQNVNFAGYENDLVIITDTNVFTIEVKSYVATLMWNQVGNYSLQKDGKIVADALDPYLQSVAHASAMSKKLKTDVIPLVLFDDGNNTVVKCENQEILNSLCSVSTLYTKIMSSSSKKKIDKNKMIDILTSSNQSDKTFEFYDIDTIIKTKKEIDRKIYYYEEKKKKVVKEIELLNNEEIVKEENKIIKEARKYIFNYNLPILEELENFSANKKWLFENEQTLLNLIVAGISISLILAIFSFPQVDRKYYIVLLLLNLITFYLINFVFVKSDNDLRKLEKKYKILNEKMKKMPLIKEIAE